VSIEQIRRQSLNIWLRGLRLPLTLAEAVAGRRDDRSWGPVLAFESFEGSVRDLVGRLTGDDELRESAALERAAVAQRRRAAELEAEAAARRADVRQEAEVLTKEVQERRAEVTRRAEDRKRSAQAARRAATRAIEEEQERSRAASDDASRQRQRAIDKQSTTAQAEELEYEADALEAKEAAVVAEGDVLDLDRAVEVTKSARRGR
jgi:uncharacterized protein YjbJ (UPF0337 family)